MATRSRYIDVATGDYTIEHGAPIEDATVASEVVLALRSKRREGFGSRLHTIRKVVPSARRLAEVYAREAIQHLIDRGEVRSPVFTATIDGTAIGVTVAYTNAAHRQQAVSVTVPIG